jgi:outer membrane lipoprotein carrier protein
LLPLLLAGAEGGPTAEILDRLQARYDAIKDLRAEFVQTSLVASLGREDVSSGTVAVRRPGRMRWEYKAPESRVIVLDGETLQIYSPEDRQLQIAPVESGAVSPTALGFLLGDGVLRETLELVGITESTPDEVRLKLRPREDAGFEFLELWLNPASYQLRGSVVVDLFGNRTRVRFRAVAENVGIEEEVFSISVPEGTEVIDLR